MGAQRLFFLLRKIKIRIEFDMEDKMEMFQVMEEYEEKLNDVLTTTSDDFLFQINHGIKVLLRGSTTEFVKNLQQIMKKETVYMLRSLNVEFADLEYEGIEEIDVKPNLSNFPNLSIIPSNQIDITLDDEYELNQKSRVHMKKAFNKAVDKLDLQKGLGKESLTSRLQ